MYIIQQYRAHKYILSVLPCKNIRIENINGVPQLNHIQYSNCSCFYQITNCLTFSLSYTCWDIKDTGKFLIDMFQIYGIHAIDNEKNDKWGEMYFPDIQNGFIMILVHSQGVSNFQISQFSEDDNSITVLDDHNVDTCGMLFFMIDPLQAIKKITIHSENPSIAHFFKYYTDTIVKQDNELLLNYMLLRHTIHKWAVMDIMYVIVDYTVCLFLV